MDSFLSCLRRQSHGPFDSQILYSGIRCGDSESLSQTGEVKSVKKENDMNGKGGG